MLDSQLSHVSLAWTDCHNQQSAVGSLNAWLSVLLTPKGRLLCGLKLNSICITQKPCTDVQCGSGTAAVSYKNTAFYLGVEQIKYSCLTDARPCLM